jgi:ketosteroid isomerase-like protein
MESKDDFLRQVNQAFADGDEKYLLAHVTEDFCWNIIGERTLGGKAEFSEALEQMRDMPPMKIKVEKVILQENNGVVEGTVVGRNRIGQKKRFGFCDVYEFSDSEDLKIRKMTSYVINVSRYKKYA